MQNRTAQHNRNTSHHIGGSTLRPWPRDSLLWFPTDRCKVFQRLKFPFASFLGQRQVVCIRRFVLRRMLSGCDQRQCEVCHQTHMCLQKGRRILQYRRPVLGKTGMASKRTRKVWPFGKLSIWSWNLARSWASQRWDFRLVFSRIICLLLLRRSTPCLLVALFCSKAWQFWFGTCLKTRRPKVFRSDVEVNHSGSDAMTRGSVIPPGNVGVGFGFLSPSILLIFMRMLSFFFSFFFFFRKSKIGLFRYGQSWRIVRVAYVE